MKGLTDRQQEVYDYIVQQMEETGYPPTIREIGRALHIKSTNGVSEHLKALVRKGYLERDADKSRALRPVVTKDASWGTPSSGASFGALRRVPLLGRIAAGQPITAVEDCEQVLTLDATLFPRSGEGELFALRVRGESMIGDGILPGDVVFLRAQSSAQRGQIVAVLLEDEATLKRYEPRGDSLWLLPANPAMEPIVVGPEALSRVHVLGVVVALVRQM